MINGRGKKKKQSFDTQSGKTKTTGDNSENWTSGTTRSQKPNREP